MTKRTTDDWEALLDGTDPAPWKLQGAGRFPLSPSGLWSVDIVSRPGGETINNAQLAITAPEAVAEVVRLRRALEELRDVLADPWQAQTGYEHGLRAGYDYAAYALARILEGDSNE